MMKLVKSDITMRPVTGTIREGFHAILDDLMNDVEQQSGAITGGVSQAVAEAEGYRHTLTLTVNVATERVPNPELN